MRTPKSKRIEIVERWPIVQVDDLGDAWRFCWRNEDMGGRATISKSQVPDYAPGSTNDEIELRFLQDGGFLGGRIIAAAQPASYEESEECDA